MFGLKLDICTEVSSTFCELRFCVTKVSCTFISQHLKHILLMDLHSRITEYCHFNVNYIKYTLIKHSTEKKSHLDRLGKQMNEKGNNIKKGLQRCKNK